MARNAAPPSATGGAGYNYADRVAAKYLLDMLAGRLPFGPENGQIVRVDWETRDETDGWLIDDLRLKLRSGTTERFVAVSLKRNRQVTQAGFPRDFVKDVWEMVLGSTAADFQSDRDLLAIVVGQLSQNVREAWDDLLREAMNTTADRLVDRVSENGTASQLQKNLFNSLRCPDNLQNKLDNSVEIATAKIVRSLRLLHLELDSETSPAMANAMAVAKQVVTSGTDQDAQSLWQTLLGISATQRESGGAVDLEKLLSQSNLPALREHPDLQHDWDQLAKLCEEATGRIRTDLGPLSLLRQKVFDQAIALVKPARVGVLIGDSGSGKSALAKRLAHRVSGPTIWLDPVLLNVASMTELQSEKLHLQNSLEHLIRERAARHGVLVIDGIEQLTGQTLQVVMQVIQAGLKTARWSILISCRADSWNRILKELRSAYLSIENDDVFSVPLLEPKDLSAVAAAFPSVNELIQRPEVRPLLTNAKMLAWSIHAIQSGDNAASARSVPGLIDAIWDQWVRGGSNRYGREHALKELARRQAQGVGVVTRLSDISEQHQVLEGLVDDELLTEHEQLIRFRHDLIGDWARLKILIENQDEDITALRERVGLPLWHHAIQLYGQRILQCDTTGAGRWQRVVSAMQENDNHDVQIGNLMLKSLFTATDSAVLIQQAWPSLVANQGDLLKRFLDQFIFSGTLPAIEQEVELDAEEKLYLQSASRYPFWPYWFAMLRSLHNHCDDVVSLAPRQVATISSIWLKWMPLTAGEGEPFPYREEAADLALRAALEIHIRHEQGRRYARDEQVNATVYRTLLQATQNRPDEVAQLCLEIVGRRELSEVVQLKVQEYEAEQQRLAEETAARQTPEQNKRLRDHPIRSGSILPEGELIPPFPDGPSRRIDDAFRNACMESGTILPLLHAHPDAAKEVFLAACIKSPYRENPWSSSHLDNDLDIWNRHLCSEPMWFQGPFLRMLQDRPEEAVDIIIRLVGFATSKWERWDRQWHRRYGDGDEAVRRRVTVLLADGEHQWIGDARVYGWYRNRFGDAPLVVNALMALEKYLYDRVDAEADITPIISKILAETDSVAFTGVLLAVGRYQLVNKKSAALLRGQLLPLLSIWQVYEWDVRVIQDTEINHASRIDLMFSARLGQRVFNIVKKWHSMPHRTIDLRELWVHDSSGGGS